jgi:membrane-associated protein
LGALAAVDRTGTLNMTLLWVMLMVAAIAGNETNFRIGRAIGPRAFSGHFRWLKKEYLERTQGFYAKHGGKTIILSRFIPIIRTFAPFVAGVGCMKRTRFAAYNFAGGILWVSAFIWGGYLFGNVPLIKENFGIVTILIVVVSVLPVAWGLLKPQPAAS